MTVLACLAVKPPGFSRIGYDVAPRGINMAVNISAMEFRSESFLSGVFSTLREIGFNPCCLELELTQSVLMKYAGIHPGHS